MEEDKEAMSVLNNDTIIVQEFDPALDLSDPQNLDDFLSKLDMSSGITMVFVPKD